MATRTTIAVINAIVAVFVPVPSKDVEDVTQSIMTQEFLLDLQGDNYV